MWKQILEFPRKNSSPKTEKWIFWDSKFLTGQKLKFGWHRFSCAFYTQQTPSQFLQKPREDVDIPQTSKLPPLQTDSADFQNMLNQHSNQCL